MTIVEAKHVLMRIPIQNWCFRYYVKGVGDVILENFTGLLIAELLISIVESDEHEVS